MTPAIRYVQWGTLWQAGARGKVTLPGGQIAVTIRRVIPGGHLLTLEGEIPFEPDEPVAIEVDDGGKPIGVYVLIYDKRGKHTEGEILRLQDGARSRHRSGERQ